MAPSRSGASCAARACCLAALCGMRAAMQYQSQVLSYVAREMCPSRRGGAAGSSRTSFDGRTDRRLSVPSYISPAHKEERAYADSPLCTRQLNLCDHRPPPLLFLPLISRPPPPPPSRLSTATMDLRCVSGSPLSTHPVWFWVHLMGDVGRPHTDRLSRARSVGGKYRIGKKIGSGSVSLAHLRLGHLHTERH